MQFKFDISFWILQNVTILCFRWKFFVSFLLFVTKIIQRIRLLNFKFNNTLFVTFKNDVNLTNMWTFWCVLTFFFRAFELIVFTKIWNSLNKKFRKHVRKFDKRITIENFIRNFENVVEYYANDINKKNAIEIAYQREMKSKQIQNFERFDRYSKSYIENYSTNYFFKFQNIQSLRNWQTFSRNVYIFASSQNRSQYSQQNQIFANQNLFF